MTRIRWMGVAVVVVVALASLGLARPAAPGVAAADDEAVNLYGGATCNPTWNAHCGTLCAMGTCVLGCQQFVNCCNATSGYSYQNFGSCGVAVGNGTIGGVGTSCGGVQPGCGSVYSTFVQGCGTGP